MKETPRLLFVDLFCGAGGFTSGAERAELFNKKIAKVIACINHDQNAIRSHSANHPNCLHFTEDIRTVELTALVAICRHARKMYPDAKLCLWASLECTNHSKAKGGLPRDADSRTLANDLLRYLDAIDFDYIFIENVEEFMAWGPLDENGKPISRKNGQEYMRWLNNMQDHGYRFDYRLLNSADFGAYTSRKRYFGVFARPSLPIKFPQPTHAKKPGLSELKKWNAVKEVLDFNDEGKSIFQEMFPRTRKKAVKYLHAKLKKPKKKPKHPPRSCIVVFPTVIQSPLFGMEPKLILRRENKLELDAMIADYCKSLGLTEDQISFYFYDPLSVATLERIFAGLIKFVAFGDTAFIQKYYSGKPKCKVNSVHEPSPTVTTAAGMTLVQSFLMQNFSGPDDSKVYSTDQPSRTVLTDDRQKLIQSFIMQHFSGDDKGQVYSTDQPARTVTTRDKQKLVWMLKYNSMPKDGKHNPPSVEDPAPTVDTGARLGLIQASFVTYSYTGSHYNTSADGPVGVVTPKDRMQLVNPEFLINNKGQSKAVSKDEPSPTLTSKLNLGLVHARWIDRPFGEGGGKNSSIDSPAGAVLPVPKMNLIDAWVLSPHYDNAGASIDEPLRTITANRKYHCLMFPQWGIHCSHSVDSPSPVLPARMDKMAPQMIQAEQVIDTEQLCLLIFEDEPDVMHRIKLFMTMYGIIDIKMRMLRIPELKRITGFGDDYILIGTQEDQKKFIGNAVQVDLAEALVTSFAAALSPMEEHIAA